MPECPLDRRRKHHELEAGAIASQSESTELAFSGCDRAIVVGIVPGNRMVKVVTGSGRAEYLCRCPDAMAEERIIYGRYIDQGVKFQLRLEVLDPIESVEVDATSDRDPILYLRRLCIPHDLFVVDAETTREISVNGDACREWHELSGALELMLGACRVALKPDIFPYDIALEVVQCSLQQRERSPEFTWVLSEGTLA